jgi:hypothetical protein
VKIVVTPAAAGDLDRLRGFLAETNPVPLERLSQH